jgi:2-keto-4-pentenoate hydratase/2-oxohepta-3-ene-1,7-dioic acid hydratase in catechol pathway
MRLATFETATGPRLGVVRDATLLELPVDRGWPTSMRALAGAGKETLDELRRWSEVASPDGGLPVGQVRLLAPIPNPGKIVAIGLNYADHAAEGGVEVPARPLVFAKFTSSVIGPGESIAWDRALTDRVDYEAELGVIIGSRARLVGRSEALEHVFGYTCLNDVSARDLQEGDVQWVRAKSLDTFCPSGPWIVTADEIPKPDELRLECSVNGELRQSASTGDMFFNVPTLIEALSHAFTLEPGDIIATGTPAGVGASRKPATFLSDGDEVVVRISSIGELHNTCRVRGRPSTE